MRSLLQLFNARRLHIALPSPTLAIVAGFSIGALLVSSLALAAGPDMKAANATYQRERAACLSGQSHQDRSICLREAGAALQEARRGGLDTVQTSIEKNRAARCDPLPPALRDDCQRRMRGEGTISGSVEQGGISRELRTVVTEK